MIMYLKWDTSFHIYLKKIIKSQLVFYNEKVRAENIKKINE